MPSPWPLSCWGKPMFLCETCFKERWPEGFFWAMSHGPCEGCRKTRACADVPPGGEPAITTEEGKK